MQTPEFNPEFIAHLIGEAVHQAKRETEGAALGDLGVEDLGIMPYDFLQQEIKATIVILRTKAREIKVLRKHVHDWGGSDYCTICGADGRA